MTETSVHDMDALASIAEDDCLYVEAGDGSDFGKVDVSVLRSELLKQRGGANLQTGTTYTLVLSDAGKVVELANASPITLTIPANSGTAFPLNTVIEVVQGGAGAVTIEITSDTLNGATAIGSEWAGVLLWKRAATEWVALPFATGLNQSQVDARVPIVSDALYRPAMMQFDGSSAHYSIATTSLTGDEITAWGVIEKVPSLANDQRIISCPTNGGLRLAVVIKENDHANADVQDKLQVACQADGGALLCRIHSDIEVTDGGRYVWFFDYNAGTGEATLVINGSDALDTGNSLHTLTTGTIGASVSTTYVGRDHSGSSLFLQGLLGFLGVHDTSGLDPADFMDGSKPKQLDEDGWTELGSQPKIFNPHGQLDVNLGSIGNLTANGTIRTWLPNFGDSVGLAL